VAVERRRSTRQSVLLSHVQPPQHPHEEPNEEASEAAEGTETPKRAKKKQKVKQLRDTPPQSDSPVREAATKQQKSKSASSSTPSSTHQEVADPNATPEQQFDARAKRITARVVDALELPGARWHAIHQIRDSTGFRRLLLLQQPTISSGVSDTVVKQLESAGIEWIVQVATHLEQMVVDHCKAKSNPGQAPHQLHQRLKGFLGRWTTHEWMEVRLRPAGLQRLRAVFTRDDDERLHLACRDARFLFDSFLDPGSNLHRESPYVQHEISSTFKHTAVGIHGVSVAEAERKQRIADLAYDPINTALFPNQEALNNVRLMRCPDPECRRPVELYAKQLSRADEPATWFWKCPREGCANAHEQRYH
jgi:hypothetical protein